MATEFVAGPIKLRNVGAKVIEAEDAESLEAAVNTFLEEAGERVLVGAFHIADLTILILYAE